MTDSKRQLAIDAAEAIDPSFTSNAMEVAGEIDPTITAKVAANRVRAQAVIEAYKQGMNAAAPRNSAELTELISLLLKDGA